MTFFVVSLITRSMLVSQMEMGMNSVQPNAQFPVPHKSLSLDINVRAFAPVTVKHILVHCI